MASFAKLVRFGLLAILCGTVSETAAGASIGINFATEGAGANFDLAPGDVTGAVPQSNWNNAHNSDLALANLADDQGAATGASVNWSHAPLSTNVPGGTPAGILLHSAISCAPFDGIVVSNIPYASFDLYLYMAGPTRGSAIFKINHATSADLQLSVQGIIDTSGSTLFVQATPTTAGNYLFLASLPGPTLFIGGGGSAAVDGLQIVATPEPSGAALGMVGIAGLAVLVLRRRESQ
jgi:hypothetical protein